jgi:hypothetical protein
MISIDPVTAVLSLVLFGAFSVPFIYHFQKNKKKQKQISQKLQEAGISANAKPDQLEIWRQQYAIGLDTSAKVLFYHQDGEVNTTFCIPLTDIKKVTSLKKKKEIDESKKSVIDFVGLELQYLSPSKKPLVLEIYDGDKFSDLIGETVLAEKWATTIQKHLN